MWSEWVLCDSDRDKLRLAQAQDQKMAIKKALENEVVPRKTDDVRPRIIREGSDHQVMSPGQFDKHMQKFR